MMTHQLQSEAFGNRSAVIRVVRVMVAVVLGWLAAGAMTRDACAQPGEVLQVRGVAQRTPVLPGDQFAVAVVMEFEEGWHAWPNVPVVPAGYDVLTIPTTIALANQAGEAPEGWTVHTGFIQWPEPRVVTTGAVAEVPIDLLSYEGHMVAYVPVSLSAAVKPGEVTLKFELRYQACDDTTCKQPTSAFFDVPVTVAALGAEPKEQEGELFKGFNGAVFAKIASGAKPEGAAPETKPSRGGDGEPADRGAANGAAAGAGGVTRPQLFGIYFPAPTGAVSIALLFLVSALGGAILNLTPCVLPVIPIKVMTLTQHAGGAKSKALRLGMWMALGVVAFWAAVGIPMAFFSAALDPSRLIFGVWWITVGIGLVITLMALGIMGLFTLNLPQSVYMINPKADTAWGSFVFGIMTAVLGLPCFGLVAGGLLAITSTVPGYVTMLIFVGLGVGMALPYLLLAAKPQLIEKIPRTGPASELVKQVMGLLLLAGAAFFVAAGLKTLLQSKPYLSGSMAWWAVAFFVIVSGVWLTVRTWQISKKTWARVVMPVLAVLGVALAVAFANGQATTAKEDYLRLQAQGGSADRIVPGAWMHWKPSLNEPARESGKVVIADFTADWCFNCKFWKRQFLDKDPVRSELVNGDVVMFEVDLSDTGAPGWAWLQELGRTGVPTLVVFSPGMKDPIIMNAYTSTTVLEALKKARGSSIAAKGK